MRQVGDQLIELYQQAQQEVVIVAPFVKKLVVRNLLEAIPDEVERIACVVRWHPADIAAGVCDLEVLDLIQARDGATLYVHPMLHAKYFRCDGRCLVGSANLTLRALGWTVPPNLELLVEVGAETPALMEFERTLFASAFKATESLRDEIAAAAEAMPKAPGALGAFGEQEYGAAEEASDGDWLPLCKRPELLFQIYSNIGVDDLVSWTVEAGRRDLKCLGVPPGLTRTTFLKDVAATLQLMPVVVRVSELAQRPISPADGASLLESEVGIGSLSYSADEHWKILKDWLLHYLPRQFRRPSGSDDIQRAMEIADWS